jgi:hypothetical protein
MALTSKAPTARARAPPLAPHAPRPACAARAPGTLPGPKKINTLHRGSRSWVCLGPRGQGGVKQSTFCMARRKSMITMGSPDFVWINTNGIISSWYLLDVVCVAPPPRAVAGGPKRPGGPRRPAPAAARGGRGSPPGSVHTLQLNLLIPGKSKAITGSHQWLSGDHRGTARG